MELRQKLSITGFRTLFVLDLLLKGAASKEEIFDTLLKNPNIKNLSNEKIKMDLNTLKAAGFEIENLGKAHGYRYRINWHPIKIKPSSKEIKVITDIKNASMDILDWKEILQLYKLFENFCEFIEDEKLKNELLDFHFFLNLDFKILKELNALTERQKTVSLLYKSPSSGRKEIPIKLEEIKYENSKLYITGKSPKYPDTAVLRIDNILKIVKILPDFKEPENKAGDAVYQISNTGFNSRNLLKEEKILNKTEDFVEIEIKADNDFMTTQRLLSCGNHLIEIKSPLAKEKYIKKLESILALYGKEEQK